MNDQDNLIPKTNESYPFLDYPIFFQKNQLEKGRLGCPEKGNSPEQAEKDFSFFNFETEDGNDLLKYEEGPSVFLVKDCAPSNLKRHFSFFLQPSNNKIFLKLLSREIGFVKEKQNFRKENWLIHPLSNFRLLWILSMVLLLTVNLFVLPVSVTFFSNSLEMSTIVFNCLLDILFVLDVVVNFRTGLLLKDKTNLFVWNPKQVAFQYFKTWFAVDLLSSLPLDYLYILQMDATQTALLLHAGRALRILRTVKWLSLLRLCRIFRLIRYVLICEKLLNLVRKFTPIINLSLLLLLLIHWCSCLQFFIPMILNFPEDCWVIKNKFQGLSWTNQYLWSFFKAMTHMTSAGYGSYPPLSINEAWIALISILTGVISGALYLAYIIILIFSKNIHKTIEKEKLRQLYSYIACKKLPLSLKERIREYQDNAQLEPKIFDQLPVFLKKEIRIFNCFNMLKKTPFFQTADEYFLSDLAMNLKVEVFPAESMIIKRGTIGEKMYFIEEGFVDVIKNDGEVVKSLSSGSNFGELCILTRSLRLADIKARTWSRLYSIDRKTFLSLLENYPKMQSSLEEIVIKRFKNIFTNSLWQGEEDILEKGINIANTKDTFPKLMGDNFEEDSTSLRFQKIIYGIRRSCQPKAPVSPLRYERMKIITSISKKSVDGETTF